MLYRKVVFLLTLVLTSSILPHAQGKKTKDNKGQELGIVITAKSDMSKSRKDCKLKKNFRVVRLIPGYPNWKRSTIHYQKTIRKRIYLSKFFNGWPY
jgi:hypothetical protein